MSHAGRLARNGGVSKERNTPANDLLHQSLSAVPGDPRKRETNQVVDAQEGLHSRSSAPVYITNKVKIPEITLDMGPELG